MPTVPPSRAVPAVSGANEKKPGALDLQPTALAGRAGHEFKKLAEFLQFPAQLRDPRVPRAFGLRDPVGEAVLSSAVSSLRRVGEAGGS